MAFKTALDIDFPVPEFSACILVELYKRNERFKAVFIPSSFFCGALMIL